MGKFKLEHKIKKGYFISSKTYCLALYDGNNIVKTKGAFSSSLTLEDFEKMYYNNIDAKAVKKDTHIDYKGGTVNIGTKHILIKHDAYLKREKIRNKEGLWVDTRPLIYNDHNNINKVVLCKKLIPYKPCFELIKYNICKELIPYNTSNIIYNLNNVNKEV